MMLTGTEEAMTINSYMKQLNVSKDAKNIGVEYGGIGIQKESTYS